MSRKWEEKLKQIEERASYYQAKPLCSVYRPRLSKLEEPPSIWKLFHRQRQAFNFAKTCKQDVHVFALEYKTGDGQRIYLVTTYFQLWFYYKSRKNLLHCYEVIPENAVCKLYFDLEFNKPANPGADGKKMVTLLIEHVCRELQDLYGINCSAVDVFNLDSSTEEKFSRHLIFQLRDAAFKDNIHVGNFVRTVLQPAIDSIASEDDGSLPETMSRGFSHLPEALIEQGSSFNKMSPEAGLRESGTLNSRKQDSLGSAKQNDPDLSFLVVKNNMGEKHLFVDLGVYTRNRNFRLYKSSKLGKHVALEIAEDNKFFPKQSKAISEEYQYFLSSLVCNVRFSDTLRILTCEATQDNRKRPEHFNNTSISVETLEGFQSSPYPEVDRFVLSLVTKNDIKGGIRRWSYFSSEELLVYDIFKYRWCENIGRAHKSNNIILDTTKPPHLFSTLILVELSHNHYKEPSSTDRTSSDAMKYNVMLSLCRANRILVDLKNEVWYQKCHDPVCKAENFKSACFPLPDEVRLLFLFKEEEEFTTDEIWNNETQSCLKLSPSKLSTAASSNTDWDNDMDDAHFLEATEDAELAEAAESSLQSYSSGVDEIPDEIVMEIFQE